MVSILAIQHRIFSHIALINFLSPAPTNTDQYYTMYSEGPSPSSPEKVDCTHAGLELPPGLATAAFAVTRDCTDDIITEAGFAGYYENVHSAQVQLCIAIIIESFSKLRCNLARARDGEKLRPIKAVPVVQKQLEFCYSMLEDAGLIMKNADMSYSRTKSPVPSRSSKDILNEMIHNYPGFGSLNQLVAHAGKSLAEIYAGRTDAVRAVFGSVEGREYLEDIYGPCHPSIAFHLLMKNFITRLLDGLCSSNKLVHESQGHTQLKILELGAGTGGTTKYLAPLLHSYLAQVPVTYTFTDLSQGLVSQAERKFQQYDSVMAYQMQDIEKPPPADMVGSQHIVVAVNAIHATPDIVQSLRNVRQFLRPDGFALIMEVQERLCWADFVFGLFEGWWKFQDGRAHATVGAETWEKAFHDAGFGYVDWTRGSLRDSGLQRVFIATASPK